MISIMGMYVGELPFQLSAKQAEIFRYLKENSEMFRYDSIAQLQFELVLRENLIKSALALNDSEVEFSIFSTSKFNPTYWTKQNRGYLLKPNVPASTAIRDIFQNGKEYGFECSTAIVVLFYHAVLESINERDFNQLFQRLFIWDWSYDEDLKIETRVGNDFIPGDVMYFYNPDFYNPVWIGENVVFLGDDEFFGHGIGKATEGEMIKALNSLRKPNATREAHLIDQHSRLNSKYLSPFAKPIV